MRNGKENANAIHILLLFMYMYVCMYIHMYMYIYVCAYVCIYTQRSWHNRKFDPTAYIFQNPNNKIIKLTQLVLSGLPQDRPQK